MNYIQEVREFVKKIPVGYVSTYGEIARILKIENSKLKISPQMVGWAMHANKSSDCPCHRVVNKDGRVAVNYAFGGADEQKKKLVLEGVKIDNKGNVDLQRCFWDPTMSNASNISKTSNVRI